MSERIAMSPETVRYRPDGAYDFVVGRDGSLQDCIDQSWQTGPSWGVWARSAQELREFIYAWAVAGRGFHLINGLHLIAEDGSAQDIDASSLWAQMQEGL